MDSEEYAQKLQVFSLLLKGDVELWKKTDEATIIRVLNALSVDFGYVQGMNVLLGPFLFTMPELESYNCMKSLIQTRIPRYVLKNLDGAHDPMVHAHISSKIPDLSIFALRYMLTLFVNSKPLSEVIKLWDAILTVGVHFNILLLCSKVMLLRKHILKEKRGARYSYNTACFVLCHFIGCVIYVH